MNEIEPANKKRIPQRYYNRETMLERGNLMKQTKQMAAIISAIFSATSKTVPFAKRTRYTSPVAWSRSRRLPHQGAKECARRRSQMERGLLKFKAV